MVMDALKYTQESQLLQRWRAMCMYEPKSSVQPTFIKFTNALLIYHYYCLMLRLVWISIPHLSSRWNWKKTPGSRWTCFGVRVPGTLDYPTATLNLHESATYNHNAHPTQTDRWTNIMAITWQFILMNAQFAENSVAGLSWHRLHNVK